MWLCPLRKICVKYPSSKHCCSFLENAARVGKCYSQSNEGLTFKSKFFLNFVHRNREIHFLFIKTMFIYLISCLLQKNQSLMSRWLVIDPIHKTYLTLEYAHCMYLIQIKYSGRLMNAQYSRESNLSLAKFHFVVKLFRMKQSCLEIMP